MELTSRQKNQLKAQAHSLHPVVQVGKSGLTPEILSTINKTLEDHELIKVKFLTFKGNKEELTKEISNRTNSNIVDIIGNIAILFRQKPRIQSHQ